MNTFAVLLICVQACLVQNAFSQCIGNAYGYAGAPFGAPFAYSGLAAYGGEGIGDVAVAGQLPVAGTTLVAGQVPIMGAVEFGGIVPAAGEVAIAGSCAGGCGCTGVAPIAAAPYGAWGASYGAWGAPYAEIATPAFSGGALPIASASAVPPSGVSVLSDNVYAGELAVRGALPFLGTVGLEGLLPTAGAGAVAYGCGNGEVAMLTEDIGAFPGYGAAMAAPYGYAGYGRAFY